MKRAYGAPRPMAWWLATGSESCALCPHTYQVDAGYYCADCDTLVCPLCVVMVLERRAALCPACATGGE